MPKTCTELRHTGTSESFARAGNTLLPYAENPPDLTIGEDDILFLDLGPVFEQWEADFGRTFVLGSDPIRLKMRHDVESAFADGKRYFNEHSDITSSELFGYAEFPCGAVAAGNLVAQSPDTLSDSFLTKESLTTK